MHRVFGHRDKKEAVKLLDLSKSCKTCSTVYGFLPSFMMLLWDTGHLKALPHALGPISPHTPTCRAVLPSVTILADTDAILADATSAAGVGTPQPPAVLSGVALHAHTGAVGAVPLARAVAGAAGLGAVLPGEALLTDTLSIHAEPAGAAAGGAAELGAVLTAVVVVTDALALQADTTAGAAPGAAGLRAVAAGPALAADTAARLQAEVPVAAARQGVIQASCKRTWGGRSEPRRWGLGMGCKQGGMVLPTAELSWPRGVGGFRAGEGMICRMGHAGARVRLQACVCPLWCSGLHGTWLWVPSALPGARASFAIFLAPQTS